VHLPVLKEEVLNFLSISRGDVVLDATLGGGGHASGILERIVPGGKLIAVDRDPDAIERNREAFKERADSIIFVNGNFRNIEDLLKGQGIKGIDGAVFDLGLSSYQLDDPSRGFSFLNDGPLDMRFDKTAEITAFEAVNTLAKDDLEEIIKNFGEERHYRAIASAIIKQRRVGRIQTTGELAKIIEKAVGRWYSKQRIHASTRTFQAIRIYVNDEITAVEKGLEGVLSMLLPGKRVCVISFHSLEDRVTKNVFKREARFGALKLITKKPVVPGQAEIRKNPRARSAKLRVAERIR
jgi:16S rRNA (cytosine1402-N4)-methyltransferase